MQSEQFRFYSTEEAYNLMQDSVRPHQIVAVQSKQEFEKKCIRNALYLDYGTDIPDYTPTCFKNSISLKYQWTDDKTVEIKERKDFNLRGLLFQFLLVYDEASSSEKVSDELLRFVIGIVQEGKLKKENIFILDGGLTKFEKDYPFMISSVENKIKAADGLFPSAIPIRGMELSFLYLGSNENAKNAKQLNQLGITHILNMADELENTHKEGEFVYAAHGVNDTRSDNIAKHFDLALKFIETARNSNGKVIVHCAMGISRSSAVVIAFLMKENKVPFEEAKAIVKAQRMCIKPNEGFVNQLKNFEKEILG